MASLLGYMPTSLHNTTLYEIVSDDDKVKPTFGSLHYALKCHLLILHHAQIPLYNTLNMSGSVDTNGEQQVQPHSFKPHSFKL